MTHHRQSAARVRTLIESDRWTPTLFKAALLRVPPRDRDVWVDGVLGLREIPADGPDLPRGCTPYLPCSVDALLRIVEQAPVHPWDVFVDLGSGVGRAITLVHLLTGAGAIGLEIQSALVAEARDLAARLRLSRVATIHGDATKLASLVPNGTVFFLYAPFSGARLAEVLANLEPIARTRMIRVCCVDVPLPPCPWLTRVSEDAPDLAIFRSCPSADRAR